CAHVSQEFVHHCSCRFYSDAQHFSPAAIRSTRTCGFKRENPTLFRACCAITGCSCPIHLSQPRLQHLPGGRRHRHRTDLAKKFFRAPHRQCHQSSRSYNIFLADDAIVIELTSRRNFSALRTVSATKPEKAVALRMRFKGANAHPQIEAEQPL